MSGYCYCYGSCVPCYNIVVDSTYARMDTVVETQSVETSSAYDAEVSDLLEQELYTKGWEIHGSLEKCDGAETHSVCWDRGVCGDNYFSFMYMQPAEYKARERRGIQVGISDTSESVEIIPSDSSLFGNYWRYFKQHVFEGTKGESLMSICRRDVKSPSFDILRCVVALTSQRPPRDCTWVQQGERYWVLFIPNSVISNIIDSLNEISIMPLPSPHDALAYNSSRVSTTTNTIICQVEPEEWDTGSVYKSISRFVTCEAVTTATFTVSVLLTPYARARGTHTSKKYMSLVVHNVK